MEIAGKWTFWKWKYCGMWKICEMHFVENENCGKLRSGRMEIVENGKWRLWKMEIVENVNCGKWKLLTFYK